jgi:oligopeptide/dipeptide ABC transporter ATP-binding protein
MNAPLLRVDGLQVHFETPDATVHAVNGVSFDVAAGETIALVGESGSGKSVTMLALLRLLAEPPAVINGVSATYVARSGEVDLLDRRVHRKHAIRGREIGYVAQDPQTSLNPTVTIGVQLTEMLRHHLSMTKRSARRHAAFLLDRVGIPDADKRLDSYPHQLSGGMRQRVMIAVAISCEPRLLIADEPTTALDVTVQAQIVDLVRDLQKEFGLAVVWITHDLGVVAGLADRVAVMYAGRLVESAPVVGLYGQPLHPYSVGLLGAVPRLGARSTTLASIPGMPPDLETYPSHCAFAPRCPHAFEPCWAQVPPDRSPAAGRSVACFYDADANGNGNGNGNGSHDDRR